MKWISSYAVEKTLEIEKFLVRKIYTNKTQLLHPIILRNYTTDTPSEDSYTKEKFPTDDNGINLQDNLYSIIWEAQSNPSFLDEPENYRDFITIEKLDDRHLVTQQISDKKLSQTQYNAACPTNKEQLLDLRRYYVNVPEGDTRASTDAPIGNDEMSNSHHDLNIRDDIDLTEPKNLKNSIDQSD